MKRLARLNERAADGPPVRLSVLDRLIDEAPDKPDEPTPSDAEAVAHVRNNLRRDLEALLNAHRRWRSVPQGYAELPRSPLAWGIADFTAGAFNDPRKREELRTEIEDAIRTFETRLTRVRVTLLEPNTTLSSTLRLRIDGLLRIETEAEPIAFDTLINAAGTGVKVEAYPERLRSHDDV
jgi:type VI secretion system protein ImpF